MSSKKRVQGRPQVNTKRKLKRYIAHVIEERKIDEETTRTPRIRYMKKKFVREQEKNVHEMMEGCAGV